MTLDRSLRDRSRRYVDKGLHRPDFCRPIHSPALPWVAANEFLRRPYAPSAIVPWEQARSRLARPWWDAEPGLTDLFRWTCEKAFGHWRQPGNTEALCSDFLDTMFLGHTFMWDSAFITMFARYLHDFLPGIRTLDNFYAAQHPSGFICREIDWSTGQDLWQEGDPDATGPNILGWAEWEHYLQFGDRERLRAVFPPLMAFHAWFQENRRWPDGTYWSTGFASGMDNQTRVPDSERHHRWHTWVDATLQMALDARALADIARELGETGAEAPLREENTHLLRRVNELCWDEPRAFYFDRAPDGGRSEVMSVGAYWALLADAIPPDRLDRFVAHLEDPAKFATPHPVPSQARGSEGYDAQGGGYWRGAVWSPTNHVVLKGLRRHGRDALAHRIAREHLLAVLAVWRETGTLWENYDQERIARGGQARPDFVGWTGLAPINVFIEEVLGIRCRIHRGEISWDLRLAEPHGIERLPVGKGKTADLRFDGRQVEVSAETPLKIEVIHGGASRSLEVSPGKPGRFLL